MCQELEEDEQIAFTCLVWEAREPDVYVNVYFGFPWGDAPDAGMTVQAITNDDPALAERVARDVADFAWRRRRAG